MATFKFSTFADADLDEIWDFISTDADDVADKFILILMEKFELLANHPLIGRASDDLRPGVRGFPCKNYLIFYFPTDYGVEVYRVLHAARDVELIFTEEHE